MIWTGAKNELDQFFKDLNKKNLSTKFDYKASKNLIMFLDIEIYLHDGKLHTEINRNETDRQYYLHIKSEHPKSLKVYLNQAIRIKRISSNQVELDNSTKETKSNFVKQWHHKSLINEHLERINLLMRIDLNKEKVTGQRSDRILLVITYNRFLPKGKLEYLTDK